MRAGVLAGAAALLLIPAERALPAGPPTPQEIVVQMSDARANLPPSMMELGEIMGMAFGNQPAVKRGTVRLGGETFTLCLRRAKTYSLKNTGKSDGHGNNTSTQLAIDQLGDGKQGICDAWYVNMPVRLGDRMFDVVAIGDKGTSITLRPSQSPLRGVVIGKKCPDFSFKTADGRKITQDTYKGKAFLLDIWSVT